MMELSGIKNLFIIAVIGFVLGFASGYVTKSEFVKADLASASAKERKDTATAVVDSVKTSANIDKVVSVRKAKLDAVSEVVSKRITATYKVEERNENAISNWKFDVGTVGLLNSMREGGADSSTTISDDEGKAASDIGIVEFQKNDSEIIKMYWDLAGRHDALVDFVQRLIDEQADR